MDRRACRGSGRSGLVDRRRSVVGGQAGRNELEHFRARQRAQAVDDLSDAGQSIRDTSRGLTSTPTQGRFPGGRGGPRVAGLISWPRITLDPFLALGEGVRGRFRGQKRWGCGRTGRCRATRDLAQDSERNLPVGREGDLCARARKRHDGNRVSGTEPIQQA
jgi:hypothetical protein